MKKLFLLLFMMGCFVAAYCQTTVEFKKPAGWGTNIRVYAFNVTGGTLPSTVTSWPGVSMVNSGNDTYAYTFPAGISASLIFNDGTNQTVDLVGGLSSGNHKLFDASSLSGNNITPTISTLATPSSASLPVLAAGKRWVYRGKGFHVSPTTDPATLTQSGGAIAPYNAGPFVDDNTTDDGGICTFPTLSSTSFTTCGARTGSAGAAPVSGPGLGCNNWDTSFGLNLQCPITNSYGNGSNALKSDITQGCPFIQAQAYGTFGGGAGGNDNAEQIAYAGYSNTYTSGYDGTCNGTKANGANFPSSSTQVRRVQLQQWNNTNPVSGASSSSAAGTVVKIPTASVVNILDNGVGNGTGVGGDEARVLIIGGNSGGSSTFNISATFSEKITISGGGFSVSDKTIINNFTMSNSAYTQNDAGSGNNYRPAGDWVTQSGQGYTGQENAASLASMTGGTVTVDFSSTASISIARTSGNADARATIGPGMGGKANLVTCYDIWMVENDALPVNLTGFSAEVNGDKVELKWNTASETNNSHFDIERSSDAKEFGKIGIVKSKGDSKSNVDYYFMDEMPFQGLNYYRLRQVDYDGKFEYSKIRSVNLKEDFRVVVYPNPTSDYVLFRGVKENSTFEIIDITGTQRFNTTIKTSIPEIKVDVSQYKSGMYIVKVVHNGQIETRKFYVN